MNFDLSKKKLTDINKYLQNIDRKSNVRKFKIQNPSGHHAICAGLKDDIDVTINGHTGYYCAGVALILGVDRILDMVRTTVNVTGDAAVAVSVAASEKQLKTFGK